MAAKKNGKNKRESFGVTLSGRGLAAVIVLFVVGLVWTFVLGVLVGRGYKPEETVPRLAELMPEPAKNATETAGGKGPGVLRPEELEFFDELQKKPEVTAEKTKPEAPEPPEKAETEPPEQTGEPRTDARDDDVYMYLYQTAAFRKADQARDFRARIESLGYSAGIETVTYGGNTWHRVLVNFKGAPEDTRSLKKALKGLGVEKPLLRGKKPL